MHRRAWAEGADLAVHPAPPPRLPPGARWLAVLETLKAQLPAVSHTIDEQAQATPAVTRLCTLPGFGQYTVLLVLAEIGEVHRFPDPKHLVSYAGLAPTMHASGGYVRTGHISRQGSKWLRWILVEAAQHARRKPGRFQLLYQRLAKRKGPKIARVAVARELLTSVYWMLRHVHRARALGTPRRGMVSLKTHRLDWEPESHNMVGRSWHG